MMLHLYFLIGTQVISNYYHWGYWFCAKHYKGKTIHLKEFLIIRKRGLSCSRSTYLSPHLRFGTVSVRKMVNYAAKMMCFKWIDLAWIFMQILFSFPKSSHIILNQHMTELNGVITKKILKGGVKVKQVTPWRRNATVKRDWIYA
jgi:hypothetical protein